ncbi:MAG: Ldh family oxidoreductase [Nannocystaceae bacterium]
MRRPADRRSPPSSPTATSAITHGDLLLADQAGVDLPADVALDRRGGRTRAPDEVAALLPIGASHKAFALSMAFELLTSLGGGIPGSLRGRRPGMFAVFLGPALVARAVTHSEQLAEFPADGRADPRLRRRRSGRARPPAAYRLVLARATHDAITTLVAEAG